MADITADSARFLFKAAAGKFSVLDFSGAEALSTPYHYQVRLRADDASVQPADLVKKRAQLILVTQKNARRVVHGVVTRASIEEVGKNHSIYTMDIHPFFWLLGLRAQSRIFQNKTVPDIVSDVLEKAGMTGSDFEMKAGSGHISREYCVQYRETDMAFVERLLAEEGIFYYFKDGGDREVMVCADQQAACVQCAPESEVEYHVKTGALDSDIEVVSSLSLDARVHTGKIVLNDYNYEKPDTHLRPMNSAREHTELEVYSHPGGFREPGPGDTTALWRQQAAAVQARALRGSGGFRCLAAGHKLKIKEHPADSMNGLYVLTDVRVRGTQTQVLRYGEGGEAGVVFSGEFLAVPVETDLRPPCPVHKIPVACVQTAEVQGPSGQKHYIDDLGRVKVRFHWERECSKPAECTCWIRVSDGYAGADHGSQFPPLPGDEVIVDFLHGDPDRPIITGRVYNKRNKPPVKPDEMIRNMVYTPYGHTLIYDDKKKRIRLETGGAENLLMADKDDKEGNVIRLITKDGHEYTACHGGKQKGIKIKTKKGHLILMEDSNKAGITIKDYRKNLTISLDTEKKVITIENKTSKAINVECKAGKVKVIAKTVDITGTAGVKIKSDAKIEMTAPHVKITGNAKVDVEGAQVKINAKAMLEAKGGMTAKLSGGALCEIKGALVKIN
jgi:type VI secretion system secreted protein VgrG